MTQQGQSRGGSGVTQAIILPATIPLQGNPSQVPFVLGTISPPSGQVPHGSSGQVPPGSGIQSYQDSGSGGGGCRSSSTECRK